MIKTPIKLQDLRRRIYRKAKSDIGWQRRSNEYPGKGIFVKVTTMPHTTHNPFDETYRVSRLRENFTSGSDGEGLETGRYAVPRQSFTRRVSEEGYIN